MVTFSGLEQESRWQFEVFALNDASDSDVNNDGSDDANGLHGVSASSNKAKATTDAADEPGAPQRLTAQFARDTNEIGGIGTQGVLLLWNPPSNPAGAPVKAYMIERKVNDGEFIVRVSSHNAATTHWVDRSEPAADETREYRITAINDVGTGTAMATVMIPYPAAGHSHVTPVLTAPDDVAVSDTGNPVTVTWTPGENADGGHLVLVFNSDFTEVPGIVVPMEEGTYTFNDMDFDAGDYVAVVVSIMTRDNYLYDYATFTVQ
jgi:hypothetical protein